MSVVIPDMDKPTSCHACPVVRKDLLHYGDCPLVPKSDLYDFYDEQYDRCPMIPGSAVQLKKEREQHEQLLSPPTGA